jgi:hypothetical protein
MQKFFCWIGWHNWIYKAPTLNPITKIGERRCLDCQLKQERHIFTGWCRIE